jgi:hypothetical protein
MEGQDSNFIELEWCELSSKIAILVKDSGNVKIWLKGDSPDLCPIINSHTNDHDDGENKQQIRLRNGKVTDEWKVKNILVQFNIRGVDYYTKGKVVEVLGNEDFWLELSPHVFKIEKRENERLLTYPHFHVYTYFKLSTDSSVSNLIFINKQIETNHHVFQKFKKLTDDEILKLQDSVEPELNEELIGFRVLDVSYKGIAFISNQKEKEYFEESDKTFEMTLMFSGEVYNLRKAKIIYNVDYVNPRAGIVPMSKIGFEFEHNHDLRRKIKMNIDESSDDGQDQKDFEDFIK